MSIYFTGFNKTKDMQIFQITIELNVLRKKFKEELLIYSLIRMQGLF